MSSVSMDVVGVAARENDDVEVEEIQDWDVCNGSRKQGPLMRSTMLIPAAGRLVTSIVGGTLATTGYVAGKAMESMGSRKAVDSAAFQAGFTSLLWSEGIFPHVKHEPLGGETVRQLRQMYGLGKDPVAKDMSITPMIVSNHTSYLDGLILARVFNCPKIIAKAGARKTPVIGKLMEEMEVIFVDRQDTDSRRATLDAITNHCAAWESGARPLLVFPEGTVTNGESLIKFKKGAFISGAPVRPVLIVYTGSFDPACTGYRMSESGPVETSDPEFLKQFMGHFIHSAHVRVLPPYIPSEAEQADPELYAQNCNSLMKTELTRIKGELLARSWKEAAGRTKGGLDYQIFDAARITARKVSGTLSKTGSCFVNRKPPATPFLQVDVMDDEWEYV